MTQVGNSVDTQDDLNLHKLAENNGENSVAYATDKNVSSKVLRTQRASNPADEILRKVTAAYTEAQLVEKLGDIVVISRAANGNPDVIEFSVDALGLSTEARPIDRKHVEELIISDESTWYPLEVCLWPNYLPQDDLSVLLRIISGNHRVTAAREKDEPVKTLQMRVYKVETELEFRILAIRSNVSHGLNFTEDQRKVQASYLCQQGQSYSAIAVILQVHKSTISRWLSGTDSNASRKPERAKEMVQERKPVLNAASFVQSGIDPAQEKVMSLLMSAKKDADVESAQMYIQTLNQEKQASLRELSLWFQKVMEG